MFRKSLMIALFIMVVVGVSTVTIVRGEDISYLRGSDEECWECYSDTRLGEMYCLPTYLDNICPESASVPGISVIIWDDTTSFPPDPMADALYCVPEADGTFTCTVIDIDAHPPDPHL